MLNLKALKDSLVTSKPRSAGNQKALMKSFVQVADYVQPNVLSRKYQANSMKDLGNGPAIYVPFPQAVPNKPVIDRIHCTYYIKGKCRICEKVCPTQAIRFDQEDQIVEVEVGAIVLATGFHCQTDLISSLNMVMVNILMLLPDFSLNVLHQLPDQHLVKYEDHLMERYLRKLYLLPVPDHAIRQKESLIVQRSAACILQNMQCCISIKCMAENHMYSIWI